MNIVKEQIQHYAEFLLLSPGFGHVGDSSALLLSVPPPRALTSVGVLFDFLTE